jgi:hypothetical protein
MSSEKVKEITKEQAEEIIGGDFAATIRMGELTIQCNNCGPIGPITDMTTDRYLINDLDELILEGTCDKCGTRVARYFDTGENSNIPKRTKNHFRSLL